MRFPTPEDPANSPVWENYIVAQVAQASLGQIPEHALAMGVKVDGGSVQLQFQLSQDTEQDRADMNEIVDGLEGLVGQAVSVRLNLEVLEGRKLSSFDGIRWTFIARECE